MWYRNRSKIMSKVSVDEGPAKRPAWFEDYVDEEDEVQISEYDITATPNDFNVSTLFNFVESGLFAYQGSSETSCGTGRVHRS
jgi:hypothetical protein